MARRRKKKKHYTISVTTDYSCDKTKVYRSRFNIFRVCIILCCCVVGLSAALVAYEYLELNRMETRIHNMSDALDNQNQLIEQLQTEKADLLAQNEILTNEVGMKVAENEIENEENAEKHMPKGFPLSGSAMLVETDTTVEGYVPISIFEMSDMSDVLATASGIVSEITPDSEYGYSVSIDHQNGYFSIYRASSEPKVSVGDEVVGGSILFVGGGMGELLGYQILKDGVYVNPMEIIEING